MASLRAWPISRLPPRLHTRLRSPSTCLICAHQVVRSQLYHRNHSRQLGQYQPQGAFLQPNAARSVVRTVLHEQPHYSIFSCKEETVDLPVLRLQREGLSSVSLFAMETEFSDIVRQHLMSHPVSGIVKGRNHGKWIELRLRLSRSCTCGSSEGVPAGSPSGSRLFRILPIPHRVRWPWSTDTFP